MSTGFGVEIPRLENEELFENLCLDLLKIDEKYENTQRNGCRGQRQDGVDIFARRINSAEWIGIQCKVKTGGKIKANEIESEINKALTFNPKLTSFYIYTTAKRDASIQEYVRNKNNRNIQAGLFSIQICFWEDIEMLLKEDDYKSVHYKYYRELYTTFKDDGYSFGKLVGLTVSYEGDEAYYELLIGRVYKTPGDNIYGLNYWKNINFIMNMNERSFETFPRVCHPSDLERAIRNSRDRYIICQWLNSIDDIEKFLKSNEQEYKFDISDKQFERYLSLYEDN
ncbi:hypothetical protein [Clostridium beijerinckii]|uniref:hypothetical protein n=1 Tax=Clostridium beijerinckii TaxID=1520 RepID=UPI0003D3860C|nr:hypothetical protein [Clostridium beijerinckii]AQS18349.1 hypothetical protein X276_27385 [Clostridium beijerinckii NRRL B-598]